MNHVSNDIYPTKLIKVILETQINCGLKKINKEGSFLIFPKTKQESP